jgi:O-antigen/teichoic acid export membrane protein
VLGTVLCAVYATRRLKWIRFSPMLFSRKAVRELVQFGGIFQIQGLLSTGLASAERLAALFFVGVEAAGLLDLARKWPNSISSIPMAFFGAFLPAASHLKASSNDLQGNADVRSLYLRGARYVNLCSSFFCGFLAVWPAAIIFVWLHEPLEHAALLMGMFAVTTQVHLLTGPGTSILRGAGHVYEEFTYLLPNVAALAIFVPLSRVVFAEWSALGVSTGVCVATFVSALIFIHRAHNVLGVSPRQFLRTVVWPGTIPYMVAMGMVLPLTKIVMQQGRWVGVGVLAIAGSAYGVVLVTILLRSILDQEEKRYLMRLSSKLTSPSLQRLAAWAIAPLSVRAEEA